MKVQCRRARPQHCGLRGEELVAHSRGTHRSCSSWQTRPGADECTSTQLSTLPECWTTLMTTPRRARSRTFWVLSCFGRMHSLQDSHDNTICVAKAEPVARESRKIQLLNRSRVGISVSRRTIRQEEHWRHGNKFALSTRSQLRRLTILSNVSMPHIPTSLEGSENHICVTAMYGRSERSQSCFRETRYYLFVSHQSRSKPCFEARLVLSCSPRDTCSVGHHPVYRAPHRVRPASLLRYRSFRSLNMAFFSTFSTSSVSSRPSPPSP